MPGRHLLMETDERVERAQDLALALVPVTHSEWQTWCRYVRRHDLDQGLALAGMLGASEALRPGPREAYKSIRETVGEAAQWLRELSRQEVLEVFGYVARAIIARQAVSGDSGQARSRMMRP